MLTKVKLALRRSDNAFDTEIQLYIDACLAELKGLGIAGAESNTTDAQIITAVIAYNKWKFGENAEAERWEHIYSDMVEKLQARSGYGLPEDEDGQV